MTEPHLPDRYVVFYQADGLQRHEFAYTHPKALEFKNWVLDYYKGKNPAPVIYELINNLNY